MTLDVSVERRLAQQLNFTRGITDSLAQGLYAVDRNCRATFINPAAEQMLGWSAAEFLGKPVHELIHYQHADHSHFPSEECPLLDVLRSGKTARADDDVFTARDGRLIPVSYSSAPIIEDGEVVGAVVAFQDISERKRQEAALRDNDQRLRMAMEAAHMGSWEWDIAADKVAWSPELEKMHGLAPGSAGPTFRDLLADVHPDDRERVEQMILTSVRECQDHRMEYRLLLGNGTVRWVEGRGKVFCDRRGKPIRMVGVCVDVSERKWTEEALRRYSEDLEQRVGERTAALREMNAKLQISNRELEDFASVASHDLQEPLRKIQAFGDRLAIKAGAALGPDGEDYLRRMKNAAGRMQTLISDLLAFSRVTIKAQPLVPVNLEQIAREVISDLETAIERNGGRVELGDMPEIEADPLQMRQLLQNLIGNALKFHNPSRPSIIRVGARLINDGASCEILVEDNGIGFEEKYLDRIFNVFQRLHGRNTYEGTGIGLAVCRKIAERHGGSITARSKPGEGSTFIVTLPVRHDETITMNVNPEVINAR